MRRDGGFTLVEVMATVFVLIFVLLSAATMFFVAYSDIDRSGEETAGTALGYQRIEWLRNQGYASTAMDAGTTIENLAGTYEGYTRTTTIVDGTPRAGVKQVTVVTDTPSGGSVEVVSLVAQ